MNNIAKDNLDNYFIETVGVDYQTFIDLMKVLNDLDSKIKDWDSVRAVIGLMNASEKGMYCPFVIQYARRVVSNSDVPSIMEILSNGKEQANQ